jgi:hypothetical protein
MYSTRYFCQALMKLGFSRQMFEKYSNFTKIPPVGAELFHVGRTDGGTDATKLVAFRSFANAFKKESMSLNTLLTFLDTPSLPIWKITQATVSRAG